MTQTTNIFEQAARLKLRFPSIKGELTAEQVWDLPLQSRNGFDLDTVAKTVNQELKTAADESFVEKPTNPAKGLLDLRLDILKHVIATRLAENKEKETARARASEKEKLEQILDKKEGEALEQLTPEQLRERIAKLG